MGQVLKATPQPVHLMGTEHHVRDQLISGRLHGVPAVRHLYLAVTNPGALSGGKDAVLRPDEPHGDAVHRFNASDAVPRRIQHHVVDGGQRQQAARREQEVFDGAVSQQDDIHTRVVVLLLLGCNAFLQEMKNGGESAEILRLRVFSQPLFDILVVTFIRGRANQTSGQCPVKGSLQLGQPVSGAVGGANRASVRPKTDVCRGRHAATEGCMFSHSQKLLQLLQLLLYIYCEAAHCSPSRSVS